MCREKRVFPRDCLLQPTSLKVPELEGPLWPPAARKNGGPAGAIDVDVEAIAGEVRAVDRTDRVLGGGGGRPGGGVLLSASRYQAGT